MGRVRQHARSGTRGVRQHIRVRDPTDSEVEGVVDTIIDRHSDDISQVGAELVTFPEGFDPDDSKNEDAVQEAYLDADSRVWKRVGRAIAK